MSIVQNPIIGRARGQAGGMVFTTLNGQNVMKAKPNSYRDANTQVQQDNRATHKDIVQMVASIKNSARSLFEKQPSDMPAFSKLIQQLSSAVDRSGGVPVFNPTGLIIGSGSVDLDVVNTSALAASGSLSLSWNNGLASDLNSSSVPVQAIIIDTVAKKIAIVNPTEATTLVSESATFSIPAGFTKVNCKLALISGKLANGADLQKGVK